MSASRGNRGDRSRGAGLRSLLVFAQPSPDIDDLLVSLLGRSDLCVLRVATIDAAYLTLQNVAVHLVIVCPETTSETVTALLDEVERRRPGTPVLAVRNPHNHQVPAWKTRTLGVLRHPVLPEVLSRTVDVALGLRDQMTSSS